jgi:uncharacterized protein (DUF433 family)
MSIARANDRITIDPKICRGKPTRTGTRTPVTVILGHIAGGESFDQVQQQYDVTVEDIRAAIAFANELVALQSFLPIELPGGPLADDVIGDRR